MFDALNPQSSVACQSGMHSCFTERVPGGIQRQICARGPTFENSCRRVREIRQQRKRLPSHVASFRIWEGDGALLMVHKKHDLWRCQNERDEARRLQSSGNSRRVLQTETLQRFLCRTTFKSADRSLKSSHQNQLPKNKLLTTLFVCSQYVLRFQKKKKKPSHQTF